MEMEMEDLFEEIVTGLVPESKSNLSEINLTFLNNLEKDKSTQFEEFNEKITLCTTQLERIELVSKYFEWTPISEDILQSYRKNSKASTFLREKANQHYTNKSYKEALTVYNLAINFSPLELECESTSQQDLNLKEDNKLDNQTLGLALANRSATLLLGLGAASEALKDIDLAIRYKYPPKLLHKLEDRRKKCEEVLEEKEATLDEHGLRGKCQLEFDKRRKFCEGILFKVKRPNVEMPSAEEFVEVGTDPIRGRKLIVNRDLPAGTVLVVEKPFVSVLKGPKKWDVEHCHYCLKQFLRGIPCTQCVFATYCDESCRDGAWRDFHNFECPCLPHLYLNSTPRYILLALRIVCKLGPDYLYQLYSNKISLNQDLESKTGSSGASSSSSFKYNSNSYEPIYNLVSHSSQSDPVELYSNALQALIISKVLEKYSLQNYFQTQSISGQDRHGFIRFLASILLRHIENIPCNSISLDELQGFEMPNARVKDTVATSLTDLILDNSPDKIELLKGTIRSVKLPQFGAGVYVVSSLMNHSCDPNVIRVNDRRWGTLAIVTTRNLKEGEEILTCYSRSFMNDPREKRQLYLNQHYYFNCTCIACEEDWPDLSQMLNSENAPIFSCGKCSMNFRHDEKVVSLKDGSFKDCILKRGSRYKCHLCDKSYADGHNFPESELNRNVQLFFEAYHMVLKNEPISCIKGLMGPLKYFQYNLCPPFSKCYMSQDVYKQALELIVYFSQTL